jgi:hypothetical protein
MNQSDDLKEITRKLRRRLTEFRYTYINENSSIHIDTVEIALNLIDFALKVNREIRAGEKQWFEGGKFIDEIVGDSEWKDISDLYYNMISAAKKNKILI